MSNRIPKRKSEKACFTCQLDNGACDECHPCSRCVQKGQPQMCYFPSQSASDRPPQKKSTEQNTSITNPFNSNSSLLHNNNSNNNAYLQQTSPATGAPLTSPLATSFQQQQPFAFNGDIIKHPTANHMYDNSLGDLSIQQYMLSEMREMKENNKKLFDEVQHLREKVDRQEMMNETLLSKLSMLNLNGSIPSSQQTSPLTDNAITYPRNIKEVCDYYPHANLFIVFDISKNLPTVVDASPAFIKLLGYTKSEIIGIPWTQIIQPDLVESTMKLFNQRNLTGNSVEMTQCYRSKHGTVYTSLDNHTFIFDHDGRPICDVVHCRLLSPDIVPKEFYMHFNNNQRFRQLTNSSSNSVKGSISTLDDGTPPGTPLSHIISSNRIHESPPTPTPVDPHNIKFTNNHNNNNNNNIHTTTTNNSNNNISPVWTNSVQSNINNDINSNNHNSSISDLNTSFSSILQPDFNSTVGENQFYNDLDIDPAQYFDSNTMNGIDWPNYPTDWGNTSQNQILAKQHQQQQPILPIDTNMNTNMNNMSINNNNSNNNNNNNIGNHFG